MRKSRFCSIRGCENLHMARGWCRKHWYRWRRHGDPLEGRTFEGGPLTFLHDVVLPYDGEGCFVWPFSKTSRGYGQVLSDGSLRVVSRLVCEIANGPPPSPKHEAAHSCGKGHEGCVSPGHLSWKTRAANQQDKVEHGTDRRGEKHHFSKLTAQDVLAIRSLQGKEMQTATAARYGVGKTTIHKIQNRRLWSWL